MNLNRTEELEIKKDIKGIKKALENIASGIVPVKPTTQVVVKDGDPFFGKIHMSEAHMDAYTSEFDVSFKQMIILMEECAELQQVLSKSIRHTTYLDERCGTDRKNLIEEITHVLISTRMVCKEFGITPEEIQQEIYKKYPNGYDVTIRCADNGDCYYVDRKSINEKPTYLADVINPDNGPV